MEAVKVRPALYKFSDIYWAWVQLAELAEILGISPLDCWKKYFHLSDGATGVTGHLHAHFPDVDLDTYTWGDLTEEDAGVIFVPAGWAMRVLKEAGMDVPYRALIKTPSNNDISVVCDHCHNRVIFFGNRCPVCGRYND